MKKIENILAVVWFILPQIIANLISSKIYTDYPAFLPTILGFSLIGLLITIKAIRKIHFTRFLRALNIERDCNRSYFLEQEFSLNNVTVTFNQNEIKIPIELILTKNSNRYLYFAPATNIEKEEVFSRIERIYLNNICQMTLTNEAFSNYGNELYWNRTKYIFLRISSIDFDISKNLNDIVSKKIADLLIESQESEVVKNVIKTLTKRNVVLMIDALKKPIMDLNQWLFQNLSKWHSLILMAIPNELISHNSFYFNNESSYIRLSRYDLKINRVTEIELEIKAKQLFISNSLGLNEDEANHLLRLLAFSFLNAEIKLPGKSSYLQNEIGFHENVFYKIINCAFDWIDQIGDGNLKRYKWNYDFRLIKDYLSACSIWQNDQTLDLQDLYKITYSECCLYVKPFVDHMAQMDNERTHPLLSFSKSPAHLLIEKSWEETPTFDNSFSDNLDSLIKDKSLYYMDWRDITKLIPLIIRTEHIERIEKLLSIVHPMEKIESILFSNVDYDLIGNAITLLISDKDLWIYFETGGCIKQEILDGIEQRGYLNQIIRIAMVNLLAPHGNQLSTYFVMIIKNSISFTNNYWEFALNIPYIENNLNTLIQRVRNINILLGPEGPDWLEKMDPYKNGSHLLENLYRGLLVQRQY